MPLWPRDTSGLSELKLQVTQVRFCEDSKATEVAEALSHVTSVVGGARGLRELGGTVFVMTPLPFSFLERR